MGFTKSSTKREVHQNASLPQETRETSHKQPNLIPKSTRKEQKKKKNSKLVERMKSGKSEQK